VANRARVMEPDVVRMMRIVDARIQRALKGFSATTVADTARMSAVSSALSPPPSTSSEMGNVAFDSDGDGTNNTNITRTSAPVWVLASTPVVGSLYVYVNGLRQRQGQAITGMEKDFTVSGATITFADPIQSGDDLTGTYQVLAVGA
jgi:hypothetical protein